MSAKAASSCAGLRLLPLLCLTLAACGTSQTGLRAGDYVGRSISIECAPFARALTDMHLSGSAADWWSQAAGRYVRTHGPEVGSILVFGRSGRLPAGHVAVVSRVAARRQILVTQANWVHHRVTEDQPVLDVSPAGDWSAVRVWWPPSRQMGTSDYRTYGFIRPHRPISRDAIVATTPAAIRIAEAGG
ncbi:CHAP domain-containing protein [Rhodopila sp.]|uniref:CHAP domain-containing protein n=1 Tax=Rhodopila sp. TaxID=2480087 RepID=UPI003D0C69CA